MQEIKKILLCFLVITLFIGGITVATPVFAAPGDYAVTTADGKIKIKNCTEI